MKEALRPGRTKLVMLESPTNPRMQICDIAAISKLAHDAGECGAVSSRMLSAPEEKLGITCMRFPHQFLFGSGRRELSFRVCGWCLVSLILGYGHPQPVKLSLTSQSYTHSVGDGLSSGWFSFSTGVGRKLAQSSSSLLPPPPRSPGGRQVLLPLSTLEWVA